MIQSLDTCLNNCVVQFKVILCLMSSSLPSYKRPMDVPCSICTRRDNKSAMELTGFQVSKDYVRKPSKTFRLHKGETQT